MTVALRRKSRFEPRERNAFLIERDYAVLTWIHRFGLISSHDLFSLVTREFPNYKKFVERLCVLFDAGYVARPVRQWQLHENSLAAPLVYARTKKGTAALKAKGLPFEPFMTWLTVAEGEDVRQLKHSLDASRTMLRIYLGAHKANVGFIPFHEIMLKVPAKTQIMDKPYRLPVKIRFTFENGKTHTANTHVEPDTKFFGIVSRGKYSFFAHEEDEATEPINRTNLKETSILKKLLCWREAVSRELYKSQLGIPNLRILIRVPNADRKEQIKSKIKELAKSNNGKSSLFLIQTRDLDPFTDPWDCVGNDPVYLNRL